MRKYDKQAGSGEKSPCRQSRQEHLAFDIVTICLTSENKAGVGFEAHKILWWLHQRDF